MKMFLTLIVILTLISTVAFADHVSGYTRKDGTYVAPYERSHRDNTVTNNYSYEGNVNSSTGQVGTNHYEHDQTSPHYTGPDSHGQIGHSNQGLYNGYGQGNQ